MSNGEHQGRAEATLGELSPAERASLGDLIRTRAGQGRAQTSILAFPFPGNPPSHPLFQTGSTKKG